MPTPPRGCENFRHHRLESAIARIFHRLWWALWMQIDGNVEPFGHLENGPEELIVQVAAADMSMDQGTEETVIGHHAFELRRRGLGVRHRQRGKPSESCRVRSHCRGDLVIGHRSQLYGDFRLQVFRGGLIERQNLSINSPSVHRGQAFYSDI